VFENEIVAFSSLVHRLKWSGMRKNLNSEPWLAQLRAGGVPGLALLSRPPLEFLHFRVFLGSAAASVLCDSVAKQNKKYQNEPNLKSRLTNLK
jgi:hypothetical protein